MSTRTPRHRTTLPFVFALLVTACATDDPLSIGEERGGDSVTDLGVNVGFAAGPTGSAGHEGSIPSTSTTTTTTSTTSTTTTTTTTTTTAAPPPVQDGDVPAPVLAAIRDLWPEAEWDRALRVARCESNYRLDAANPTSSARGVFQLLAPWTRDPGSGRTVWGWDYTDDGEKLSAAAGLGIAQDDARYGLANITVAHLIWERSGWGPWEASRSCWSRS